MRSPNYPAIGLGEAEKMALAVWGREKRSFAPATAIVQAWGYAGMSGNARTKLSAMLKYGLLEDNSNGDYRLSDRAMHMLHNHPDSAARLDALREAALSPELFLELQQTYPDASIDTLRSYLITKKGFSDTGAESCIKAFRETQEVAKLSAVESSVAVVPAPAPVSVEPGLLAKGLIAMRREGMVPPEEATSTFRWPLSRGVVAEVRFIGNAKPAHLDLLKQYLEVAKTAMALEAEETEGDPQ